MGKILKIALGSIAGFVGLTWVGLQTPYVAPASEIIKSSWDGISDCLRIKKREPGDVTYRNVRNLSVRQDSFKFEVGGDSGTFQSQITRFGNGYRHRISEDNKFYEILINQNCNLQDFDFDLTLFRIDKEEDECASRKLSQVDVIDFFFSENRDKYFQRFRCPISRQRGRKSLCEYYDVVGNWGMTVYFPYEYIEDWQKVIPAARAKFNESFEPLDYCPLRVPFI